MSTQTYQLTSATPSSAVSRKPPYGTTISAAAAPEGGGSAGSGGQTDEIHRSGATRAC